MTLVNLLPRKGLIVPTQRRKRRLIMATANSILLYGSEIYGDTHGIRSGSFCHKWRSTCLSIGSAAERDMECEEGKPHYKYCEIEIPNDAALAITTRHESTEKVDNKIYPQYRKIGPEEFWVSELLPDPISFGK